MSVGIVRPDDGRGHILLHDAFIDSTPFDLDLDLVLERMPLKTFVDITTALFIVKVSLPVNATLRNALDQVLRLLSGVSKCFLTSKVD